jgi:hypothetical protein
MRGGIVAGVVFVLFEMLAVTLTPGVTDVFRPFRIRSAIVFGPEVIDSTTPAGASIVTGSLIHLGLSSLFGSCLGTFLAKRGRLTRSLRGLILAEVLYGLVLWLVNIYTVAPAMGWTWFLEETDPVVQALGHTLFFGVPLALFLYWASAPRRHLGLE